MKNILRSGAVLAMVLGLSACGGKAGEAIGAMKKAADDMCACKDKACADKVNAALEKTMEKYKDVKGTEADGKKLEPIMKKMMDCSMKAMGMGGDAPATP
jgi:Sec-independent protein translocase protein TatA